MRKLFSYVLFVLILPMLLLGANGKVGGKIIDQKTGEPLVGANVVIVGTSIGSISDADGYYTITDVAEGDQVVSVTFIGYEEEKMNVKVVADKKANLNFKLESKAIEMQALEVLASRADNLTPVAFSNVEKEEMQLRLGSQDIPLVMNTTPSVYSTNQGGGAGDARINVRGFNQRNVAIMINGVPVNDMENGWVYWSNWDGVGDATSSIQMQRGLSAVNLATPSIGGTMNIITDPTLRERSLGYKQEIGQYGFLKSTLSFNSGMIADKLAFNGSFVRKIGDGYVDKTWIDSWAYYLGGSYSINKSNRIELYALGAPQRHGQNLYKQNMAVYNPEYAKELNDYDKTDSDGNGVADYFDSFNEQGGAFNQNWSPVSSSYTGQQAVGTKRFDRHSPDFINERENFYHKPQVNLNYYSTISEKLDISSVLYYSGGIGGGTGTYGKIYTRDADGNLGDDDYKYYYGNSPWYRDWDATIAMNSADADTFYVDRSELVKADQQSMGILRNSRNDQNTIGLISKVNYKLSNEVKFVAGVDWRKAQIEHYREVRDLLGGDYYVDDANEYDDTDAKQEKVLGDKVAYNFSNTVDWLGFFGQGEYKKDRLTAYGTFGYTLTSYTHNNHFLTTDTLANGDPDINSPEVSLTVDGLNGYQVKGGASYLLTDGLTAYTNVGYVSKIPIFDAVINDRDGSRADDPKNEKFTSFEGGINMFKNELTAKISYYNTVWKDRTNSIGVVNQDGTEGYVFITGMDAIHSGIEMEFAVQPIKLFRLDIAGSIGNWKYLNDVSGTYKTYDNNVVNTDTVTYYVKDLKIGDAPQTQFALSATVFPISGMKLQFINRIYQNHYANWDPFSRDALENGERPQSWEIPNYYIFDFHANYKIPYEFKGVNFNVFAHVFNILDETYIQDATDNSQYNAYGTKTHSADDAEVFFGNPRSWNLGVSINL